MNHLPALFVSHGAPELAVRAAQLAVQPPLGPAHHWCLGEALPPVSQ